MSVMEHWMAWKQLCALELCPPETRRLLRDFAHNRYLRFAAAYARTTNLPDANALTPESAEAWHWFETHLRLRDTRGGKCFKEWLFARESVDGEPTIDSIQGGATLLMRNVVRERLRREFSSRGTVTLDVAVPIEGGDSAPSFHELLAGDLDTAQAVEQHELEAIATAEAAGAAATLNRRERVALLAREIGLSLAHTAVTRAAGCGKSVLNTAYHNALVGLAGHVRARYPAEANSTLALLTCLVFERVRGAILLWGRSESACAQLFLLVDHDKTT